MTPARSWCNRAFGVLAVGVGLSLASRAARAQTVSDAAALADAVSNARPGTTITLLDGTYALSRRLAPATGGTSGSPITVRAQNPGRAILDASGIEEAFLISVPYWKFENLRIHVRNGSKHAYKLDTNGHHTVISGGMMELETRAESGVKGAGGPRAPQPDDVLIEGTEIWFNTPTESGNAEGIDAVAVARWVIRANVIHDIQKSRSFDGIAYGAFTKGNSQDTIIENNLFYNCFIAISLGGGGTGTQYFRDGETSFEDRNGVIRNNMVLGSNDVAIYLNQARGARIYNNTLFNSYTSCGGTCAAIDIRYTGSSADVRNNIVDRPIRDREGGTHTAASNLQLASPADGSWFIDAAGNDLHLKPGAPPIDRGETLGLVPTDRDGTPRPFGAAYDIGAHEFGTITLPGPDGGVRTGDAGRGGRDGGGLDGGTSSGADPAANGQPGGAAGFTGTTSGGCSSTTLGHGSPLLRLSLVLSFVGALRARSRRARSRRAPRALIVSGAQPKDARDR